MSFNLETRFQGNLEDEKSLGVRLNSPSKRIVG